MVCTHTFRGVVLCHILIDSEIEDWTLAFFCCLMLLDRGSASRPKERRALLRPPDKPFPKESVHVHSGGDVPHQRANTSGPGYAHGSNATAKTLKRGRPPQTTFLSLRKTAPESRPTLNAV